MPGDTGGLALPSTLTLTLAGYRANIDLNTCQLEGEKDSMVRLRLRRVGAKNQPSYRIVAADKESPRDGRFLEAVGVYNPRTEPETIQLKEDLIYKWLSNGAQPSDSVKKILERTGLFERYERFQAGESLETLMQEATKAEEQRTGSPQTRHPTPSSKAKQTVESED